ncbi:MAG TPA: biotin attachment protein [Saprospirales bacterium]|nr:biotin attachment protein [Saprospirales bacterium]
MLNISKNNLPNSAYPKSLKAMNSNRLPSWHWTFRTLMGVLMVIVIIFLLLPWTQNVRADGRVTTLRPEQRPQTVHATIAGRIERWYVVEGQAVKRGDTLVFLSEVKSDYFDPSLVARVGDQVVAKKGSITSYGQKADALLDQIAAMKRELDSKMNQIWNKIEQAKLKIESDSIKVVQTDIDLQVAKRQFEGIKTLYDKGLEPLTKFEERRLKLQDAETKRIAALNQLASSKNELAIYQTELRLVQNETANKIAKAESDRFSTLSDRFDAQATVSKLQIERENYALRQNFYYILAPQDGFIVQAIKPGVGEIIKEGEPLLSIQPADYQLAVEMYVKPLDLPLIQKNSKVRFLFDGWPAFFFSGWPGVSLGTFGGQVVAIDRNISANGKFRVLIAPDPNDQPWPTALMPGGGAKGIALLNDVPLWYELWRIVNGFPPDLYQNVQGNSTKEKEAKK